MFDDFSGKLRRLFLADTGRYATARPQPRHRTVRRAPLAVEGLEERALLAAAAIGFVQSNLVSDIPGLAAFTDPQLINPWGLTASPRGEFWVSDNQTGFSTLSDGAGN
jgi:hypothetical protein